MNHEINLAVQKEPVKKQSKKLLFGAGIFFLVVFLISGGLIAFNYFLSGQLNSLDREEAQQKTISNRYTQRKLDTRLLVERLSEIGRIIGGRSKLDQRVAAVFSIFSPSVNVEDMDVSESVASLSIQSRSLYDLNQLFTTIEKLSGKSDGIERVSMTSFGFDPQNLLYTLGIQIAFSQQ